MRLPVLIIALVATVFSLFEAYADNVFAEYNGMKFMADRDFEYNELYGGAELIEIVDKEIDGDLIIPDQVYFPETDSYITVNSVPANVIKSLPNVTSITFPSNMYALRSGYAVSDCPKLQVINLGKNLNSVSTGNPFYRLPALREINVPAENKYFTTIEGAVYTKDKTQLRIMPQATRSVSFPAECTTIGRNAFFQCHLLEHLTIPEHITTIDNFAFMFCSSLKEFEFPETVTTLGGAMFQGCTSLERVVMNSHFDSVTGNMFWNCQKLKEVVIGENVNAIYKQAFDGCGQLEKIILLPVTPPTFVSDLWFYEGIYDTCALHVPAGTGNDYRNAYVWKNFSHIVDPLEPISTEELTAEYFVDNDPGVGKALKLNANDGLNQYSISLAAFSPGAHIFGVRALTSNGIASPTVAQPIYIADEQLYNDLEYFIDTDPGEGKGIRPDHGFARVVHFNVTTDKLALGSHTMNVRIKGDDGKWSPVMTRPFVVVEKIADLDFIVEYFYDVDPGIGLGHQIQAAEGRNTFFLPLEENLTSGAHLFGVRCADKEGNWSFTKVNPLFIMPGAELERVEYFVDNDPGEGFGNAVAVDTNVPASFVVRTDNLEYGNHRLSLRGMDKDGVWQELFSRTFIVEDTNGVDEITWAAGLRISLTDGTLTLHPSGLLAETAIEVYALNGMLINRSIWENTEDTMQLGVGSHQCLIVRAIQPDGYYCVDTIR